MNFIDLSEGAQDLIIRATLGEFDFSPPPEIPEKIQNEIALWAQTKEI